MTTPDVNTLLVNFPTPGNEMVVENEDGSYTILINAKLSQDGQLKAYQHALNHINNEDFEKSEVQSIEYQAHELEASEEIISASVPVDKYEKRILQLRRERKKIQKALKERQKEIKVITELYGPDYFEKVARDNWLYGGIE